MFQKILLVSHFGFTTGQLIPAGIEVETLVIVSIQSQQIGNILPNLTIFGELSKESARFVGKIDFQIRQSKTYASR